MADEGTLQLIRSLNHIAVGNHTIVGDYTRYDERLVRTLKDALNKIVDGFETHPRARRENHLLWAVPGTGKTYFVEQIAASHPSVTYQSLNLAELDEHSFTDKLRALTQLNRPTLCLIDEIDARPDMQWPYEVLLPYLDSNANRSHGLVFVLAGSSGANIEGFIARIEDRHKGEDLMSRIPQPNRYAIPKLEVGDRIVVAISQLLIAATEASRAFVGIDKLALFYIASEPDLAIARQLHECAVRAVERYRRKNDSIRYDDLFDSGDQQRYHLYRELGDEAEALAKSEVRVEPAPTSRAPVDLSQANLSIYTFRFGKYAKERIFAATGMELDEAELDADMTLRDFILKMTNADISEDYASKLALVIREDYFTKKYLDYDDSADLRSVITEWHLDLAEVIGFAQVRLSQLSVIYAGIGNGRDLPFVCPRSKQLAAVDVSRQMLAKASKQRNDIVPYHTSAEELAGVPASTFDVYLALRVYQSALFDPMEAARSARRVLRKGGIAIVSLPDAYLDRSTDPVRVVRGLLAGDRLDQSRPYEDAIEVIHCLEKADFHELGWMRKRADIYIWGRA